MAEQFCRAWRINRSDLFSIVGSNDDTLLKKITKKRELAEEIDGLIREHGDYTLAQSLQDIICGKLVKKRSYEYVRALEFILEIYGKAQDEEAVLSGRGWQDIGSTFTYLKMPVLHKIWKSGKIFFPWENKKIAGYTTWPVIMIIEKNMIKSLKKEIEQIDPDMFEKKFLPARQKGLESELGYFLETMTEWLGNSTKDLVLILDGQQ